MIRLCLIATLSVLIANSAFAQQTSVDTLYTGLKKATSFTFGNDAIYIVEAGAHRVLKLGMDGKLIERYGKRGSGNYQFDNPVDIATTNGLKLFVSDKGNNRIQVFDKRWQYLSSISGNNRFQTRSEIRPAFLGVNKLGDVYFYDERSRTLGKYNEDGAILDQVSLPAEVKQVSGIQLVDGSILILDKKSELIHRISENGFYESFYEAKGTHSFFYRDNEVYVAKNNAIEKLGPLTKKTILSFEKKSEISDIYVVENKIYILTSHALIRILEE